MGSKHAEVIGGRDIQEVESEKNYPGGLGTRRYSSRLELSHKIMSRWGAQICKNIVQWFPNLVIGSSLDLVGQWP